MAAVDDFLDKLDRRPVELPDLERADLHEDSRAGWTRKRRYDEELDKTEFLKRRLVTASALETGRYSGKKVSAKEFFTGEEITDLARPAQQRSGASDDDDESGVDDSDEYSDAEQSESDSERTVDFEHDFDAEDDANEDVDLKQIITTISSDAHQQKGESIRRQLAICDQLMNLQIHCHAALRSYNRLPRGKLASQLIKTADAETVNNYKKVRKTVREITGLLTLLEDKLLRTSKQAKSLISNGKELEDSEDEEIQSSADENEEIDENASVRSDESLADDLASPQSIDHSETTDKFKTLDSIDRILERRNKKFESFRNATLTKWDERLKLRLTGKKAKTDFSQFESQMLKQIDQIMSEKNRLIRRTQLKRCELERIGGNSEDTHDAEIFDDGDFYQQLLKELIERKSAGVVDPIEMSRQWLEMQNMRQKRSSKKKIDTKASKGRKIRYVVIPKLVNFFPSMPQSIKWTDDARNQLFKSLFAN